MTESRTTLLTGIAYSLLLIVAVALIQNFSYLPSGTEALEFFKDRGRLISTGAFIGGIASIFLVWFAAGLASHVRPTNAKMATIAFGGAVFAASITALGFLFLATGAERVVTLGSMSPDVAATLYDLAGVAVGNAAPFGLALLTGAVAVAGFRTRAFPSWLSWVSGIVAIGLLSPINYVVVALVVLWVPAVGIWLSRRTPVAG